MSVIHIYFATRSPKNWSWDSFSKLYEEANHKKASKVWIASLEAIIGDKEAETHISRKARVLKEEHEKKKV